MSVLNSNLERDQVITQISRLVKDRIEDAEQSHFNEFIQQYYRHVTLEDLQAREIEDLYGAALSHWNLGQQRDVGEAKVHVYNPVYEVHGWQSRHTVIEIIVDDMPYLVNSLTMEINRHGLTCHLVIHPVINLRRNDAGEMAFDTPDQDSQAESFIHVEVDFSGEMKNLAVLRKALLDVLRDAKAASEDWQQSMTRMREASDALRKNPPADTNQDIDEVIAYLDWVTDDHFVFLGSREYHLPTNKKDHGLSIVPDSGLGILRDEIACLPPSNAAPVPADVSAFVSSPCPLVVTKASTRSSIHRSKFMDYVGVKKYDDKGDVIGEYRFLGLYTSTAYHSPPLTVPFLRKKVDQILKASGFSYKGHSGKALMSVLSGLPRDELFHASVDELLECAIGVLHLQERQRIRLFIRRDLYGRYLSALVYVPRDRYNTDVRVLMQKLLLEKFQVSSIDFNVQFTESILARIYFTLHTEEGWSVDYDVAEIERQFVEIMRDWKDDLRHALRAQFGESIAGLYFNNYGNAFPSGYQETFTPRTAVFDIERMETLRTDPAKEIQMLLYRPLEEHGNLIQFKLFCRGHPAPLSKTLPMLENMGVMVLDERPYKVRCQDNENNYWLHDFGLVYSNELPDIKRIKAKFQATFARVWYGHVENDGFNRLVMRANLDWRQIMILRAYYLYLRQTGATFSQSYVEQTLNNNPQVTVELLQLFDKRFNPQLKTGEKAMQAQIQKIEAGIEQVTSLDEDRILRRYMNLIQATIRTNFYQHNVDARRVPYVSFKFDPAIITHLPSPRPRFEIFVYSPRVEGVHLRGGPVARGGLRWSDRREDFRTEVLGLMKAQVSKNAVIVPTGAKGGFYVKRPLEGLDRDAVMTEVIECYSIFIGALLDITDNLVNNELVHPDKVVRYDGDDPYLVVAADKGTATFSDIANSIAIKHGFWLGDAFASGGSVGYDHKKMGITARGAWESVKRNFRELGVDTQTTPFSVIGIGDMGGDVFGNGMLLSEKIRLLGAFNHMHIFLDPDPDPASSFKERKRLFEKPRSNWKDYSASLISKGGGIFSRSDKSIPLSAEVQQMLGVNEARMPPNDLIQAMLRAEVDLLWNGGIGTYVKSSQESNDQVGDRANDGLRINGAELRCKVIGEGGNLGFTQLGRIEAAAHGVSLNTDAIDNSAGVDCSDHEVNIKILLNNVLAQGDMTEKQRNSLLAKMTDEVGELVLRNNYLQTQAISMVQAQAVVMLDVHSRLIDHLGQVGHLNRKVEFLPAAEALEERKSHAKGLYRPELAVVLAYSKLLLKEQLIASPLLLDESMQNELSSYFPTELCKRFPEQISQHRLRGEIITNQLVNKLVNRLGPSFPFRMQEETGANSSDVIRYFKIACEIFQVQQLWRQIEALDNQVAPAIQLEMLLDVRKLIERAMFWLRRNRSHVDSIKALIDEFSDGVVLLQENLIQHLPRAEKQRLKKAVDRLTRAQVPRDLANQVIRLEYLYRCLDIIAVQAAVGHSQDDVMPVYFDLSELLQLDWLLAKINRLPRRDFWQSLARTALRDDLHSENRALAADLLKRSKKNMSVSGRMASWREANQLDIDRYLHLIESIQSGVVVEIEQLSVILKELHSMVEKSKARALANSG